MHRWKKLVLVGLCVAFVPLYVLGDPPVYSAAPIHGKVVNKQTGEGLAGVVVLAEWKPYQIGLGHGSTGGAMKTIEVVTDNRGHYDIPAWGPRLRPLLSYMNGHDPQLRYFKSGYFPKALSNGLSGYETRDKSVVRKSEWDGKVIELVPFNGADWEEYTRRLSSSWSVIGDCLRECPRMVLALEAENKRVKLAAPQSRIKWSDIAIESFAEDDRDFFMRYKNENK